MSVAAPLPGQVVRVRSRQYLVEEVIPPPAPKHQTLVRLSCLEDDAQGQELEALWEKEVDAQVLGDDAWKAVGRKGFDEPRLFSAWLNTLRWNCVTSTDPRLFQSPWRAGIQVMTYQLEPLRKAPLLPRVNLLIADDVGLGKTIEAGVIVRELLMRQKVRRYVRHLKTEADASTLRVSLADKLHNARAILRDHRAIGEAIWDRFNASAGDQLWYFESLLAVFRERSPGPMADELAEVVGEIRARHEQASGAGRA